MARTMQTARKTTGGMKPRCKPAAKPANKTVPRKRYRRRSGTVAIREIRKYQKTTKLLIPQGTFDGLVRDISHAILRFHLRYQKAAMMALQESAEDYVVGLLKDANLCAIHAKRTKVRPEDIHLAKCIRGVHD